MDIDLKQRAIHRTKIIKGQLNALQQAIEQEDYCMDILVQGLAIQKSLASLNKLVLENHLQTHIAQMFESNNEEAKQKAITELLNLYELNNIRSRS